MGEDDSSDKPGPAGDPAAAYLAEQTRLARLRAENLIEQNAFELSHLRFRRYGDWIKAALETAAALVAFGALIWFGAAAFAASRAGGVVIDAFQVPASLAERGLTGQTVAARVQDDLLRLQSETDSIRAPSSYQNDWGDDIRVVIPNTGVSLGEIDRLLRQWLGHETRITGEVWRTDSGIAVTARAGGEAGEIFFGKQNEIDALLHKASESIYARTQPYRYANYLVGQPHRVSEAITVLERLIDIGPASERSWAQAFLATLPIDDKHDWRDSLMLFQSAITSDPANANAMSGLVDAEVALEREEGVLIDGPRALALFARHRGDLDPVRARIRAATIGVLLRENVGDYTRAAQENLATADQPNYLGSQFAALSELAFDYGALHDGGAFDALIARLGNAHPDPDSALALAEVTMGGSSLLHRPEAVIASYRTFGALEAGATPELMPPMTLEFARRVLGSWYALALAERGDFAAAETALRGMPADCDLCLRTRGEVATLAGQWGRAAYWLEAAERHGPSLPVPPFDMGILLLRKGDFDGAIAQFAAANRKGPHFADPLELWGEALIAKNRSDLALAKFEEAARYAPKWGRLHLKWGEALWWLGRKDDARKQFALAAGLYLTAAEARERDGMRRLSGEGVRG